MAKKTPLVSVVVPVRNEERYIGECLRSLMGQDYPKGKYEVLVVDGRSEDRTRDIVGKFMKRHRNIRLIENPELNVSAGRDVGFRNASGEIVVSFSGHSYADRDFLSKLVSRLVKSDESVAGVGCRHETPASDPPTARAIGLVTSSAFGGMGTTFKNPEEEQVVDSVAFTVYRKKVIEEVGGPSDPELGCTGNDAELNLRIKEAGYKLLYTPDTTAYHHKRAGIYNFFRWVFNYGVARAKIVRKHRRSAKLIHALPSIFIIGLVLTGILSFFSRVFFFLFLFALGAYFLSALGSSVMVSRGYGPKYVPRLLLVYFVEHVGYGLGFLYGVLGGNFV